MRSLLIFIFIVALALTSFGQLIGPTEDPIRIGVGARLMGMGKAFVAVADDGSAIFMNPAGLTQIDSWYVLSMYSNLLNEIPYITLSYAQPFEFRGMKLAWSLGYVGSGVADIPSPSQTGFTYFDYHNNVYLLSLAARIDPKLRLGLNLKLFDEGFTGTVQERGTGKDIDIGILYALSDQASLGVTLQNTLPSSLGGRLDWDSGYYESIPAILKFGGAFKINENLLLAIDNDIWLTREYPLQLHGGLEWEINPILILRTGIDQSVSSATRKNVSSDPTFGVGLRLWGTRLDYAYHPYHEDQGNLTHYFSLSFSPDIIAKARPKIKVVPTVEAKPIMQPPGSFEILMPFDRSKTYSKEIKFEGTFEAISMLIVGGQQIRLRSDNTFSSDIPLKIGRNEILVLATDRNNQVIKQQRTIYRLPRFIDVDRTYWARKTIQQIAMLGIMSGYPDNKFKPKAQLPAKHAQIMITRLQKLGMSQKDLAYLRKTLFRKNINRAQAAAAIARTEFFKQQVKSLPF